MLRRKCVHYCSDGLHLFARSLATEAPSTSYTTSSLNPLLVPRPTIRPVHQASVIVTRSPTISRSPTKFEKAFFQYQLRISRALHNPFPYEFYFKQGSPLEAQFNIEERKREKKAFGRVSKIMMESTEANREAAELAKEDVEQRAARFTEADRKKHLRSLDRKGERNLYLIINKNLGHKTCWSFPEGPVQKGEFLHQTAERVLHPECGINMDTWMVGRKPIGLYQPPVASPDVPQTMTFFYKLHILAGHVRPNNTSVIDYAWLTKQEIRTYVEGDYWHGVKDMLSDC